MQIFVIIDNIRNTLERVKLWHPPADKVSNGGSFLEDHELKNRRTEKADNHCFASDLTLSLVSLLDGRWPQWVRFRFEARCQ